MIYSILKVSCPALSVADETCLLLPIVCAFFSRQTSSRLLAVLLQKKTTAIPQGSGLKMFLFARLILFLLLSSRLMNMFHWFPFISLFCFTFQRIKPYLTLVIHYNKCIYIFIKTNPFESALLTYAAFMCWYEALKCENHESWLLNSILLTSCCGRIKSSRHTISKHRCDEKWKCE